MFLHLLLYLTVIYTLCRKGSHNLLTNPIQFIWMKYNCLNSSLCISIDTIHNKGALTFVGWIEKLLKKRTQGSSFVIKKYLEWVFVLLCSFWSNSSSHVLYILGFQMVFFLCKTDEITSRKAPLMHEINSVITLQKKQKKINKDSVYVAFM